MKRSKKRVGIISLLLIILAALFQLYGNDINNALTSLTSKSDDNPKIEETNTVSTDLKVTFIDVGQADSILIQNREENMLIDAGNNEDGDKLVNYLKSLGVENFKYVVGTHPHEDHIGGLDDIINSFSIDKLYLPDAISDSKTFVDVLDAVENKNVNLYNPTIDETFQLGEATFKVLYTGSDSETKELNDTSIVLKMNFGNNSFLFMGDASSNVEKKLLSKDIEADVLKVGHHGSRYSSSEEFLDEVDAKYAIISCGINNSYKHPHDETLKKLKERNINIYRTDEVGTIIVTTDGEKISVSTEKTDTNG